MEFTVYSTIRRLQKTLFRSLGFSGDNWPALGASPAPAHQPEMLLIGCIDARLNLKDDVGIPDGKALIYRNIAALVAGKDDPAHTSVAAALEFAIDNMHVKKIVVMGHTHCGGIHACLTDGHKDTHHIEDYLQPLEKVRGAAVGKSLKEQARAMEKAAVVQSLDNLMTYEMVKKAVENKEVELQGWVIDTATKLIWEFDPNTKEFRPMGSDVRAADRPDKILPASHG